MIPEPSIDKTKYYNPSPPKKKFKKWKKMPFINCFSLPMKSACNCYNFYI